MDAPTRHRLEAVRKRMPRYVFRAWNDCPHGALPPSGGRAGLNTPQAITPLAFANGNGRHSVYCLKREEFAEMVMLHLTGAKKVNGQLFETHLSSWSSSLSFVLQTVAMEWLASGCFDDTTLSNIHISIMDTKELWDHIQVLYVPSLDFLKPGRMTYWHECLAYGIIEGDAHEAVPFKVFYDAGIRCGTPDLPLGDLIFDGDKVGREFAIKSSTMERSRAISKHYGEEFDLPMCLAIVCRFKRDSLLLRDGCQGIDAVLDGIDDLVVPEKWEADNGADFGHDVGYGDVEQFIRLMHIVLEHRTDELKMPESSSSSSSNASDDQSSLEIDPECSCRCHCIPKRDQRSQLDHLKPKGQVTYIAEAKSARRSKYAQKQLVRQARTLWTIRE